MGALPRFLARAAICCTWFALGSPAGAQDLEARLLQWDRCVERQFRDATGNSVEDQLALEFAFGMCRTAERAAIAGSGKDYATATRMMSEAKAAIRRRLLDQP
jgi:hypothetical protein